MAIFKQEISANLEISQVGELKFSFYLNEK